LAEAVATAVVCVLAELPNPWLTTLLVVACIALTGAYRHRLNLSVLDLAPRVAPAAATGAVLAAVGVGGHVEVRALLVAAAIACSAALSGRFFAYAVERRLRRRGLLRRRTIVVGAGTVAQALAQRMLDEPECGLQPVALLDDEPSPDAVLPLNIPIRPLNGSLRSALVNERIDTVVIAFCQVDEAELLELVRDCYRLDCEIFVVPRLWEVSAVTGDMDRVGAVPVVRISHPMRRKLMWHAKLFMDRTVAGAALLAISPLLAVLALAVHFSDRTAPVLFRQTRVGLDGGEFELLKFRSMSPANSLDELPQLWNVLRGDMALVGPRPERPHFVEEFSSSIPGYSARHQVPVGLTGWAAINGLTGDTSIAERARYDNFYIANWSLWFDVKIVFQTVWVLVGKFRRDLDSARSAQGDVRSLRPTAERRIRLRDFGIAHPIDDIGSAGAL
jgi:lipopolysaccharide/colanic/teichoic acid biosynthesis glycosyltransferase